jgi:UDP-N-acetyl-D-mannosaminuronate dehydrogenase
MPFYEAIVVGVGEVGKPLLELVRRRYSAIGIDLEPAPANVTCRTLHICFPFSGEFIRASAEYIKRYCPVLAIINSTVAPGTTRAIHGLTRTCLAYSPVRGKHDKMKQDLVRYTKYIGGIDRESAARTSEHFQSLGMRTKVVSSPEAAELAKLTETTYFGLLIAWAQEVERYCDQLHVDYSQIVSFYEEISFFPAFKYAPGIIGGHCVMPNIRILESVFRSDILSAIVSSNERKIAQAAALSSTVKSA